MEKVEAEVLFEIEDAKRDLDFFDKTKYDCSITIRDTSVRRSGNNVLIFRDMMEPGMAEIRKAIRKVLTDRLKRLEYELKSM